jgi:hypothetical protein
MSCRRPPQYHSDRGWILGVALTGTLTWIRSALRGFTRVRCCSTPPASSPHALAGSRSCFWLTVASNRPCRGLAPPIGHSCSTYPFGLRPHSARSRCPILVQTVRSSPTKPRRPTYCLHLASSISLTISITRARRTVFANDEYLRGQPPTSGNFTAIPPFSYPVPATNLTSIRTT